MSSTSPTSGFASALFFLPAHPPINAAAVNAMNILINQAFFIVIMVRPNRKFNFAIIAKKHAQLA